MKIAKYKGGMFGEGSGEVLSCCLCGEKDYDRLIIHRIGIAIGMSGDDYTFCDKCLDDKNFGWNLLKRLGYPHGILLKTECVDIIEDEE